jgi:hypothetical protein
MDLKAIRLLFVSAGAALLVLAIAPQFCRGSFDM